MAEMTAEQIEQHNIKTYEEKGSTEPYEERHIYTQCKGTTCIEDSMSIKGHKLICNICVYKVFGSIYKAYEWMEGSEEDG